MVTNSSGERSFSKLKFIKNELRSRMMQERLNCLPAMSIESDVLESLNFDDIKWDFAESKTRKRCLWENVLAIHVDQVYSKHLHSLQPHFQFV